MIEKLSSRRRFLTIATGACLTSPLFGRHGQQRDVTWLAEVQAKPQNEVEHKLAPILAPEADLADWTQKRKSIRQTWLDYLGAIDRPDKPPSAQLLHEEQMGGVTRQLLRYESEPGWATEAYLLKPVDSSQRPRPGVVVFHSTVPHSIRQPAGVEGKPEKAFGLRLAQKGFVALCPRNFLWSDNHQIDSKRQTQSFQDRHANSKGMAKMLLDAQVAVDLLISLPGVDPSRIGSVGHSLGAKEVLYLSAFDDRIRATVSSEGGIGTEFSNWDAPWYLGPQIADFRALHEHHELVSLIAPRPFLLIGGESADGDRSWPFIDAATKIYRLYKGVPRIGLYNHRKGHSIPPDAETRIYDWLETYLGEKTNTGARSPNGVK